jgi:Flp pilus assembly pilin Flp
VKFKPKLKILRNEKGASAVEFALILVPLIILIFAIFEFGIFFNNWIAVTYAAREGARLAAVDVYLADIKAAVIERAPSVKIDSDDIDVVGLHGEIGSPVTVTVKGKLLKFELPLVPGAKKDVTSTSSATLRIEWWNPDK